MIWHRYAVLFDIPADKDYLKFYKMHEARPIIPVDDRIKKKQDLIRQIERHFPHLKYNCLYIETIEKGEPSNEEIRRTNQSNSQS